MLHTKKPLKNPQVETSHVATTAKNNPFLSATIQKKENPFLKNEPSKGNPFLGNTASQAPVQGDFQMIYVYMVLFGVSMLFAYQMLKRTSKKTNEKIENEIGEVEKPNTENERPDREVIRKKLENVGATKQEQKSVDEIIPKKETTEKKQEDIILEKVKEQTLGKQKEVRTAKKKYNPHEEKKKKEQKQIEEGTTEKKVAVKEKPKYKKFEGVTKCPKPHNGFIGEKSECHLHVDISQEHFKYGKDKGGRVSLVQKGNGYTLGSLLECLEAVQECKGSSGFEDCEEWLKYHINEYLDQNPSEKEDDTDTEEEK